MPGGAPPSPAAATSDPYEVYDVDAEQLAEPLPKAQPPRPQGSPTTAQRAEPLIPKASPARAEPLLPKASPGPPPLMVPRPGSLGAQPRNPPTPSSDDDWGDVMTQPSHVPVPAQTMLSNVPGGKEKMKERQERDVLYLTAGQTTGHGRQDSRAHDIEGRARPPRASSRANKMGAAPSSSARAQPARPAAQLGRDGL